MGGGCIANDAGITVSTSATYTILNAGASPTGALSIQLGADAFGQFVIVPGTDTCTGASLAPNGSCTFDVQFQTTSCPSSQSTMNVTDANGDQLTVGISESMG
jgi:hypothetical protein